MGLKTIIPSGAGSRGWGAGQWAWPSADGDDNIVLGLLNPSTVPPTPKISALHILVSQLLYS